MEPRVVVLFWQGKVPLEPNLEPGFAGEARPFLARARSEKHGPPLCRDSTIQSANDPPNANRGIAATLDVALADWPLAHYQNLMTSG